MSNNTTSELLQARKRAIHAEKKIERLEEALAEISEILKAPAGNRRFMQIANPARQCRGIIRRLLQ